MEREQFLHRLSTFTMPSKKHRWFIYYNYFWTDLKQIFNNYIKEGDKILDIGCGNKPYEPYIRSITKTENKNGYIGCDVVQSSEKKTDIICEGTNIPLPDETFDVIICTQVIEHVFKHQNIFKEAYRLLKPNGIFIVSSNFVWELHEVPYDFYRFTPWGYEALLKEAGFAVLEGKANGGRWATFGQLVINICSTKYNPDDNWLKGKIKTMWRRCVVYICNVIFPLLDNKYKDSTEFSLNHIYVGKK